MTDPGPRPAAAPIPAATVLVLRDRLPGGGAGPGPGPVEDIEVLLVRRSHRASFMANAYVFPGGRVDAADRGQAHEAPELALRRAAARELTEEVGLQPRHLDELVHFAHWITPSVEPKRFDTAFFLWPLGAGRQGAPPAEVRVDGREVFDPLWITPTAALLRYEQGELNLPPPTACTLEDLTAEISAAARAATSGQAGGLLQALLTRCAARKPLPTLPKFIADADGGLSIVMPWDDDYLGLPGEGSPVPALAEGAAPVPRRIRRCSLKLEGLGAKYAVTPSPDRASTVPWIIARASV
jgi:8-oxo-dGTP pyrophosphatase MutT (NUDIX family)